MNYYIIPKSYLNINNVNLKLQLTSEILTPFICHSLFFYLNDTYNQIYKLQQNIANTTSSYTAANINTIINPYEHISIINYNFNNNDTLTNNDIVPLSSIFFELFEICKTFNIEDFLNSNQINNIAHLTYNYVSSLQSLNVLHIHTNNTTISCDFNYDNLTHLFINNTYSYKLDLIICEFKPDEYADTKTYLQNMLLVLSILTRHQGQNGICIIKIDSIFHKMIVDIIFLLSSLYSKIYLAKPTIMNITEGNKYLICKGFMYKNNCSLELKLTNALNELKISNPNDNIYSILYNEIPSFFLNKLEETNIILGQQQIEIYDQLINLFKHKNSEEKIDTLRKNNIQKYHNLYETKHLIDKPNMFLQV
jgi:hypothetical protein